MTKLFKSTIRKKIMAILLAVYTFSSISGVAVNAATTHKSADLSVYSDSGSNQTALSNDSMISVETINIGNKITLTAKAIGGTGPYKYKYYCKPETDSKYTALTGSTTETTYIHPLVQYSILML